MNIAARTGAWSGKPVPYDAEVEWIRGIGYEDFINTLFIPYDSDVITWIGWAEPHRSGMDVWADLGFAAYKDEDTETTRIIRYNTNPNIILCYFRSKAGDGGTLLNVNNTVKHHFVLRKGLVTVDGVSSTIVQPSFKSENRGRYLLVDQDGVYLSKWRLERVGDVLLDMIAVRITNSLGISEGAMYDRVSGKLYRNEGTGAFVIGPDKAGTDVAGGGV